MIALSREKLEEFTYVGAATGQTNLHISVQQGDVGNCYKRCMYSRKHCETPA